MCVRHEHTPPPPRLPCCQLIAQLCSSLGQRRDQGAPGAMNLWGTSSENSSLLCEEVSKLSQHPPPLVPSLSPVTPHHSSTPPNGFLTADPPVHSSLLPPPRNLKSLCLEGPPPALLPKSQQDLKEWLTTPSSGKPSTTAQFAGVLCLCFGVQLVQTLRHRAFLTAPILYYVL